jgi:hypothetical protein
MSIKHLLNSLSSSFQSLIRVLIHGDKKTITYNEMISALLIDDLQRKLMALSQLSSSSRAALYVTHGRSQDLRIYNGKKYRSKDRSKSRGKSQDKRTIICWNYGKKGYMKRDCRSKAKANDSYSANVTSSSSAEDLYVDDIAL